VNNARSSLLLKFLSFNPKPREVNLGVNPILELLLLFSNKSHGEEGKALFQGRLMNGDN
jgi:hypothetical protein